MQVALRMVGPDSCCTTPGHKDRDQREETLMVLHIYHNVIPGKTAHTDYKAKSRELWPPSPRVNGSSAITPHLFANRPPVTIVCRRRIHSGTKSVHVHGET